MSDTTDGAGFATLAIHAGAQPDLASIMPVHLMSCRAAGDGGFSPHQSSPACTMLEERVATIEGGTAALAVASGHAARTLALHTLMQAGDELVAARRPDTPSLEAALRRFGWQVRWAEAEKPESFVEALSDRTKALLVESLEHIPWLRNRKGIPFAGRL